MLITKLRQYSLASIAVAVLLALIIAPFILFGSCLEAWSESILNQHSGTKVVSISVFALLASDIVLPLPSSLISTAAGAQLGFAHGTFIVFLGLTLGHSIGYFLGRYFGQPATNYILGVTSSIKGKRQGWAHHIGLIVTTRAVPVLSETICVVCGVAAMPFGLFLISISLANFGLAFAYCWLGSVSAQSGSFVIFFGASVALPVVGYCISWLCGSSKGFG